MQRIFILTFLIFIFSCNSGESAREFNKDSTSRVKQWTEQNDSSVVTSEKPGNSVAGCYWKLLQRDTFALALTQTGNELDGRLTFNNFQKDKSSGMVHGELKDGIIKLWYSFQSEGMNSVMEVYFKREGDRLIRGLGPVEVKGDTAYFKSENEISYDIDQTFIKVDCSQLPGKYRINAALY